MSTWWTSSPAALPGPYCPVGRSLMPPPRASSYLRDGVDSSSTPSLAPQITGSTRSHCSESAGSLFLCLKNTPSFKKSTIKTRYNRCILKNSNPLKTSKCQVLVHYSFFKYIFVTSFHTLKYPVSYFCTNYILKVSTLLLMFITPVLLLLLVK